MKKDYTKIIFVIDRSASMDSIRLDMEGGFNTFIESQKKLNIGTCDVSLYQFDDVYETVFENKNIHDVNKYELVPRNCTALYDAIGKTINNVGKQFSDMKEEDRPDKVIVAIITDGHENASKEFNLLKVREMITHQSTKYNWQFTYLGSNQDAWEVGSTLGIAKGSTLSYTSNTRGVADMWGSLTNATSMYRSCNVSSIVYTNEDIQKQTK